MIIWNWGRGGADLGQKATQYCPTCAQEQPFRLVLQYRYFGLYWVFCMVTAKTYMLLCSACRKGQEVPAREVEPTLSASPIPFMRRFGLFTLACVVVGIIGLMALFGGH